MNANRTAGPAASPYHHPRPYRPSQLDSTPDGESLPVVVVGAGPVGLAVALGLVRRGVPVTVLEAATQVSFGSRAICVSRHSLEIASRLGFGDRLARRALGWTGGRSFYGDREILRFTMPHEAHAVRPPMVNVSQSELEQAMVDTLGSCPLATLRWGTEVTGWRPLGEGAELDVATAGGPRTLRAAWVVAADGGRSRMREAAGLRLSGTAYEGRYVIADIHWKSGLPTERLVWFDPPSNPGSTVIMHRQPDDIWRIDYQLAPEDDAEAETTEDRIRERITAHLKWLENDTPWTLEWHGFYKARALALDDFVSGRVIFAGDAAHLVPIFGVRGMNSGLEDADTLAWTLAAVVTGDAGPELLAAYSAERHHAWEQNVGNAGKSTLIMTPGTDGYRATRDALLALSLTHPEFRHLIDPRQSSATHARGSVLTQPSGSPAAGLRPGDPLEDRQVRIEDGTDRCLHDLRGSGFGIYAVAPADPDEIQRLADGLRAAFTREDVTTVLLGDQAGTGADVTVADDGGTRDAWRAGPGEVVVVRPDGIVAARGPAASLTGLAGRLRDAAPSAVGGRAADPDTAGSGRLTPEQEARERVWLALSETLDATAPGDRAGLLTRLALILGDQAGPDQLRRALAAAARATK